MESELEVAVLGAEILKAAAALGIGLYAYSGGITAYRYFFDNPEKKGYRELYKEMWWTAKER